MITRFGVDSPRLGTRTNQFLISIGRSGYEICEAQRHIAGYTKPLYFSYHAGFRNEGMT